MKKTSISRFNDAYSTFGGNRSVVTSLDFGQLTPLMADEVLPRDKWLINLSNSLEIAPLAVRTRNDIFYNQGAFFVSCAQLDRRFNDIATKKIKKYGVDVPDMYTFGSAHILQELVTDAHMQMKKSTTGDISVVTVEPMTGYSSYFFDQTVSSTSNRIREIVSSQESERLQIIKDNIISGVDRSGDLNIVYIKKNTSSGKYEYFVIPLYYNKVGQALRKVFDGLGYKMPMIYVDGDLFSNDPSGTAKTISLAKASSSSQPSNTFIIRYNQPCGAQLNAYPLLAYLKIFNDHFSMTSTRDDNPLALYLEKVYNRDSSVIEQANGALPCELDAAAFLDAYKAVSLQLYSDDVTRSVRNFYLRSNPFYTTGDGEESIEVPNTYVASTQPSVGLGCSTHNNSMLRACVNGNSSHTVEANRSDGGVDSIHNTNTATTYIENKLVEIAHRYLITDKLLGSSTARRLRQFFGITEPIDDAMKSVIVGVNRIPLQIDGERIMTNTYNGRTVDEDAGTKIGIANAGGRVRYVFRNDNVYGYGITLNWLSVRTVYANRNPRYTLKVVREDMYDGQLDGQGFAQNISQMEINNDRTDGSLNYCFGQEPLYEEYRKMSIDYMSGDILRTSGMKSYLIPRDFRNIVNSKELYAEFSAVRSVRQSTDEFSDLWITKDGSDPVLVFGRADVLATRNVQDSVHAMALPAGNNGVSVIDNLG